ncbi:MAG: phosphoribosylglycinamide formyltransferase [Candidatus Omnitrophota bacterium]
MKNIAVFASGQGSNFQAIVDGVKKGKIKNGVIGLLVCDKPDASCLKRAEKAGIKKLVIDRDSFKGTAEFEEEILNQLKKEKIDLICLAGFMRVLSGSFIKKYENKILNIHPSLLPSFKGARAVRDALKYGVKITGVTVHFVTEEIDAGPIVAQEAVAIKDGDIEITLLERIHAVEHKIYPFAINLFCCDKLKITGKKVVIKWRKANPEKEEQQK